MRMRKRKRGDDDDDDDEEERKTIVIVRGKMIRRGRRMRRGRNAGSGIMHNCQRKQYISPPAHSSLYCTHSVRTVHIAYVPAQVK